MSLNAGVGQGDSNSCLLYNIATIPIALALSKSPLMKEVKINISENKSAQNSESSMKKQQILNVYQYCMQMIS